MTARPDEAAATRRWFDADDERAAPRRAPARSASVWMEQGELFPAESRRARGRVTEPKAPTVALPPPAPAAPVAPAPATRVKASRPRPSPVAALLRARATAAPAPKAPAAVRRPAAAPRPTGSPAGTARVVSMARYLQVNRAVDGACDLPQPVRLPRKPFFPCLTLWRGSEAGTPFLIGT